MKLRRRKLDVGVMLCFFFGVSFLDCVYRIIEGRESVFFLLLVLDFLRKVL